MQMSKPAITKQKRTKTKMPCSSKLSVSTTGCKRLHRSSIEIPETHKEEEEEEEEDPLALSSYLTKAQRNSLNQGG
jgi:hypothetical protein